MKKKIILWLVVILWMGLIFYFSSKNAEESTNQSQGLINKTSIVDMYDKETEEEKTEVLEAVDKRVRKIAHAIVFMVLAILVCFALNEYNLDIKKLLLIAFIICFLYACSDEIHQLYVYGRSGEVRDVIIDNIGCLFGYLVFYLFKRRRLKYD